MPPLATVLLIVLFAAAVLGGMLWLLSRMAEATNNPRAFLQRGRRPGTHTVVVCAGDSITHGALSADYVEMLRRRFGPDGYEFVNAGINGHVAHNLLQRLDAIIACQPEVVTILIGTNDVNATFDEASRAMYRRRVGMPQTPTLEVYRHNIELILDRLQAGSRARLLLLELPMVGEVLDAEINGRIREYNAALRAIAAQKGIPCLPLYERLCDLLPADHQPPRYDGSGDLMAAAIFKHVAQRKGWDSISQEHGFAVLTDHLHLNDRAAAVIAELIGDFLRGEQSGAV